DRTLRPPPFPQTPLIGLPLPQATLAWGTPPPHTRETRNSRTLEEGNNEEICLRGPASSGASGSTAFDPDPLTPQPEVTVPQAGTGHSASPEINGDARRRSRLRQRHSHSTFQAFCPAPLRVFKYSPLPLCR